MKYCVVPRWAPFPDHHPIHHRRHPPCAGAISRSSYCGFSVPVKAEFRRQPSPSGLISLPLPVVYLKTERQIRNTRMAAHPHLALHAPLLMQFATPAAQARPRPLGHLHSFPCVDSLPPGTWLQMTPRKKERSSMTCLELSASLRVKAYR